MSITPAIKVRVDGDRVDRVAYPLDDLNLTVGDRVMTSTQGTRLTVISTRPIKVPAFVPPGSTLNGGAPPGDQLMIVTGTRQCDYTDPSYYVDLAPSFDNECASAFIQVHGTLAWTATIETLAQDRIIFRVWEAAGFPITDSVTVSFMAMGW